MYFNPRTHVGCDRRANPWSNPKRYFNPRTHVGCDVNDLRPFIIWSYFNPRTHVGCDPGAPEPPEPPGLISIHAPTWGATVEPGLNGGFWVISIHAPTWGATILRVSRESGKLFQSTHPRGVRHGHGAADVGGAISIHAPTWGATAAARCFSASSRNFNPRTHVGCDLKYSSIASIFFISIHAPTWGATLSLYLCLRSNKISIHAPTWGATTNAFEGYGGLIISIHAPTWGATIKNLLI